MRIAIEQFHPFRWTGVAWSTLPKNGSRESTAFRSTSQVRPSAPAPNLTSEESRLLREVRVHGTSGLAFDHMREPMTDSIAAIETRLAALGLRPTTDEKKRATRSVLLPFFLLLALGAIRLITALPSGKPVGWLIVLMFLTAIPMSIIAAKTGHLTEGGKKMLESLRLRHRVLKHITQPPSPDDPKAQAEAILALALFGPSALKDIPEYKATIKAAQRGLQDPSVGGEAAIVVSGCSTGGCSSGCGGSGCGGCGGD